MSNLSLLKKSPKYDQREGDKTKSLTLIKKIEYNNSKDDNSFLFGSNFNNLFD